MPRMAFSIGLDRFDGEGEFVRRFLVPLLGRLGFRVVVPYGGPAGEEMVFADVDRFGRVRYYGLCPVYEAEVGATEAARVAARIERVMGERGRAFAHPQRGTTERLSGFYCAAAAGDVGLAARARFDAELEPFRPDVWLLTGEELLALDRGRAAMSAAGAAEVLQGLRAEVALNQRVMRAVSIQLADAWDFDGAGKPVLADRLHAECCSGYLARPPAASAELLDAVTTYRTNVKVCNMLLTSLVTRLRPDDREGLRDGITFHLRSLEELGENVARLINQEAAALGPLGGV